MTELSEGVAPGQIGWCDPDCPFCGGAQPQLLGYKTKHGALKDERRLGANLASSSQITNEKGVGKVFPTAGGGDPHQGWIVKPDVMETFEVAIRPTPHHLIPGQAATEPSSLEQWTCESKGKILEDIGYNVDCAENGIWLPHLPHIHWTRYFDKASKTRYCDVFGAWATLGAARQTGIGRLVMGELWLQMHYTDHDDPYRHVDNDASYDDEAKEQCNKLGDLMSSYYTAKAKCKNKDSDSGKFMPPYGLVGRINGISSRFRRRITGKPTWWSSWVSTLAQDYTDDIMQDRIGLKMQFLISRK